MNELHGGNFWAYQECLDFSANLNPLGMPAAVRQTVMEHADLWEHYPDPECLVLRWKLAKREQVPAEQIVCGNGADDLIWRIVQAVRPRRALLAVPTFSEYRRALESIGCAVETFPLCPENGFVLPESFLQALHPGLDLVILCNPNNPTGRLITPELMREICRICGENDTLFLSDECFLDFAENGAACSARQHLNAYSIVLNAFTKTYVMPGLRLGYAVFGDAVLAARVQDTGQYWSVSAPAQIAGMAALDETEYLEKSRQVIAEERKFLIAALAELGMHVFPSNANFILFQGKTGLFRAMLEEHIHIRSCENFEGLDETYYRIAVRTQEENDALLKALRRCLR